MTGEELLAELAQLKITIAIDGDELVVADTCGVMTPGVGTSLPGTKRIYIAAFSEESPDEQDAAEQQHPAQRQLHFPIVLPHEKMLLAVIDVAVILKSSAWPFFEPPRVHRTQV